MVNEMQEADSWQQEMHTQVQHALAEDIGTGDIHAALFDNDKTAVATIVAREPAVVCGLACVVAVYQQLDATVKVDMHVQDGDMLVPNQTVLTVSGAVAVLLSGERVALNFLQTLSATATMTRRYVDQIKHTNTQILDTRKTIPGLRHLQKYAVRCGGGSNHRFGLYDAYLIKENHIYACGSIAEAVQRARALSPARFLEVEVENLDELQQAIELPVDRIMLDNFTLEAIKQATALIHQWSNRGQSDIEIEISGNINLDNILAYAEAGVDYISVGALTKHIHAIDFSMRVVSS